MCYRCGICREAQGSRLPRKVYNIYRTVVGPLRPNGDGEWVQEGRQEIAREVLVCQACYTLLSQGVPYPVLLRQRGQPVRLPAPKVVVIRLPAPRIMVRGRITHTAG